jgi:tetratricopeptide (TPR) repeat protein
MKHRQTRIAAALVGTVLAAASASTPGEVDKLITQAAKLRLESRYPEAEPILRQAVELWSAKGPEAKRSRALAMSDLGSLLLVLERYPESERTLTRSLHDLEPGPDASHVFWNLAILHRNLGDLPKAESCARQASAMVEGPDRVAPQLILASVYIEQKRYQEAESILAWAEEGAGDALRVVIDNYYAAIALPTGKYTLAEEVARRAIEAAQRSLPAQHPAAAAAWNNLGQACRFQGDYLEAEHAYRESMQRWERNAGPGNPSLARVMMNLGALYHERGREAGAETLYQNAATILEAAFGRNHCLTLVARNELADVLRAERRFTEAGKLSAATLAALDRTLPPGDARRTQALKNRWRLLQDTGRLREASASAAAAAQTQPQSSPTEAGPFARIALMRAINEAHTVDWEQGYVRHLEWHRQVKDPFNWYSYSISVSTERQRCILYATFGHTASELSNPVSPVEDERDTIVNLLPHVQFMGSSIYQFLPALSRGNGVPTPTLRAEFTTVDLKYGGGAEFEAALATEQSNLRGETLWYRMVEGGNLPRYVRLRPRSSLQSILEERADQTLPEKATRLISTMTVEILNLRPNMLVNVTPEP